MILTPAASALISKQQKFAFYKGNFLKNWKKFDFSKKLTTIGYDLMLALKKRLGIWSVSSPNRSKDGQSEDD